MKKLIALMSLTLGLCSPAMADPEIKNWYTYHSMGCMMLRECTKDTSIIDSVEDLGEHFTPYSNELNKIFESLELIGVEAYLADEKYFKHNTRGLYDVTRNRFFLNKKYIEQPKVLLSVIRHEGWHIAQDCMAGTLDNTFTAVILQDGEVPDWITNTAMRTYKIEAAPYEAEAMYAAFIDGHTASALEACASAAPMWETYEPTPMTRSWLRKNGFIR